MENDIIELLQTGKYSCVVRNNNQVYTFTQRGVADLYELYHSRPQLLDGADIADKVVGKGAATLMVLGKVRSVYTNVISTPALELFREAGVPVQFRQEVPRIENRAHTGWCPLETRCYPLHDLQQLYATITDFVAGLKKQND